MSYLLNPTSNRPGTLTEVFLVFANDERYDHLPADHAIHRDLLALSTMHPTHWPAVQELTLDEVVRPSSSTSLYGTPTYFKFASALLRSLDNSTRQWIDARDRPAQPGASRDERLVSGPPGMALLSLRIRGYVSGSPLNSQNRHTFNRTLPIRSEFQTALEVLLKGLSAPLNVLALLNVSLRFSLLRALAHSCTTIQLDNVIVKEESASARWTKMKDFPGAPRAVEILSVDERGLSTYFTLRPLARIKRLRLMIGDAASHSRRLRSDLQYLLDDSKNSLEELHYVPYWSSCIPDEKGELRVSRLSREWLM